MVQLFWKTVWQFLLKLNIYIKYIFTIQLSDATTQKEMKIYVHSKIHIWRFIAALFIILKSMKQSKWPSREEWIVNHVTLIFMKYCVNGNRWTRTTWMNCTNIMLRKATCRRKKRQYDTMHIMFKSIVPKYFTHFF